MVNSAGLEGQVAPVGLEPVRTLLNSWLIPNDTRQPTDNFAEFARARRWRRSDAALVRELRDDLRHVVETADAGPVNRWIERTALRPRAAAVVSAISAGTWTRLKACPDCHWVFYDNTRNGSKRWCLMYAGGPEGRACGTIAKVRRYRDTHQTQSAR
jgi:CGNR zinc finger/Putative stress-induced transcription regulator